VRRTPLGKLMIKTGLARDASEVEELISSRSVSVDGAIALSSGRLVAPDENVTVLRRPRFVSRGGEKLAHAIDHFGIAVEGRRAIDIGASTGGFTDCLLQRGIASVVALDTGQNLIHERLRADPRVVVMEGRNIRHQEEPVSGAPFDVVVVDVSFMSVKTISNILARLVADGGDLVVLVKPQFESSRAEANRGEGVITDPAVHERVVLEVRDALASAGLPTVGVVESPITGQRGNVEFLLYCRRHDVPR